MRSWINPSSIHGGVLAVAAVAYLAAVYLVWDARRLDDTEMAGYFRRRALVAAAVVGVVGLVGLVGTFVLRADASYLFEGLTSRALPLVILTAVCGVSAIVLLVRNAPRGARASRCDRGSKCHRRLGRGSVAYVLPETLTFSAAAAPSGTLAAVLAVVVLAAVIVVPGFALLYVLDQKGLLPEEGVDDEPAVERPAV